VCGRRDIAARRWEVEDAWPIDVDTPVPTPTGWKTQGTLEAGDYVFGSDGRIASVTEVSTPKILPSYRLEFTDGSSIIAAGIHPWSVKTAHDRTRENESKLLTTERIFETQDRIYGLKIHPGLQMPEANLPIDPYVLGLWLGDGSVRSGELSIGIEDANEVQGFIREAGYESSFSPHPVDNWGKLYIRNIKHALIALGIESEKRIPAVYLRASHRQRLALLQGLMDTDGWFQAQQKQCGWGQSPGPHSGLIADFSELLNTLGVRHKFSTYARGDCGIAGKNHVFTQTQFQPSFCVFRLKRKADFQQYPKEDGRTTNQYITKVSECGDRLVRCVTVDTADHQYLAANSFIVTHNSQRLFKRGYQYLWPRRGGGWVALGFSGGGYWGNRTNRKFWGNETNIYAAMTELITAALTRDIPDVRFEARDCRSDADITAKDAASRYANVFASQNDLTAVQTQIADYLCTDGRVILVTDHTIDAQAYGRAPLVEQAEDVVPETEQKYENSLLFIVRHGETDKNTNGELRGINQDPLNAAGRREAEKVASFLTDKNIQHIVCSPVARSVETAEYISRSLNVPMDVDERIEPFDLGDLAGEKMEDNAEEIRKIFKGESPPPGDESIEDFDSRIAEFMMDVMQSRILTAIVCHDSVICSIGKFVNPESTYVVNAIPPGGVSVVETQDDTSYMMRPVYPMSAETPAAGTKRGIPRGQETVEVCGKLEAKVPMNTQTLNQMGFVGVSREFDVAYLKAMFPDKAEKIKPGGSGIAEIELDRIARINTALALEASYVTGDSLVRDVTLHRVWMRPCMFMEEEDPVIRKELLENFPDGVKVYMAGDTFLQAVNECLDDHITLIQGLPGTGQNRKSLCSSLMPIQRRLNTWMDLLDAFATRVVPQRYIDSKLFNVDAIAQQQGGPGPYVPFLMDGVAQGRTVQEYIFVEPTPTPQPFLLQLVTYFIESLPQMLAHATPQLFGSPSNRDIPPMSGVALSIQRDQALAAQSTPWHAIKMATCSYYRQAVQLAARCRNQSIHETDQNGEAVDVELDDLKGNVLCYPQDDSNIPISYSQKKAEWKDLLTQSALNPIIGKLMAKVSNIRSAIEAMGLEGWHSSEADAYEKQMGEMDVLLSSGPLPNPAVIALQDQLEQMTAAAGGQVVQGIPLSPEQEQAIAAIQQQMQALPPNVSTVQVKPTDDNASEAEACLDYINDARGRKLANGTAEEKAAYENLVCHFNEHKVKIPPPVEPVKPASLSISSKDMPPDALAKELEKRGDVPTSGTDVVTDREHSAELKKASHPTGPQVPQMAPLPGVQQ
jgi:broad specificity phosphatase PhoE